MVALFVALALGPRARAVERLPIEDFAREPEMARTKMSPNGQYIAFLREDSGRMMVYVKALDEKKGWSIDPGTAPFANDALKEVDHFAWVSDRRLLLATAVWECRYGVFATDFDGSNMVPISGYEALSKGSIREPASYVHEVLATGFTSEPVLLMIDRHEHHPGSLLYPDVVKVDTLTGFISVVAKNPGDVIDWEADDHGVVRAGVKSHGKLSGLIYRADDTQPWREILPMENRSTDLQSLGYDSASGKVVVAALDVNRRWAPYGVNPVNGDLGEPLLSDPEYDIVPARFYISVDGVSLSAPIFGPAGNLIAYRYFTEAPRVKWFDKNFAEYQRKMDHVLPKTVNIPVKISRNGKRILWFAFSDQDPGTYLLSDLETNRLRPLGRRMSWIKPEQMAPMLSIKYSARDGVTIHGYLTTPVGHEAESLPMIILPHGGPWARDIWEFDPLVQLLANRGYAVLQINYRGSPGYGEELFDEAQREIGGKIQNDIEDATRWAVAVGVADPKRIAILGASYGGYSALFALGKTPDLYRCGVSIAGVTDWLDIFQSRRYDSDYKRANEFWREHIGDPEKDAERLRAVSPVNFAEKITAPVLLIQGKEDRIVPKQQANLMIAALEKAGRKPEKLFLSKVGHSYGHQKERTMLYKRVVEFLEKNLGPGVE